MMCHLPDRSLNLLSVSKRRRVITIRVRRQLHLQQHLTQVFLLRAKGSHQPREGRRGPPGNNFKQPVPTQSKIETPPQTSRKPFRPVSASLSTGRKANLMINRIVLTLLSLEQIELHHEATMQKEAVRQSRIKRRKRQRNQ
jgi:hypothetical protein